MLNPESLGRWARDDVREVGVVTGCLLLVPARIWSELGGFDTRFFMYGEDADFSMRAWRAGWRPVITPDATIMHVVGAASAQRADRMMLVLRGRATVVHQHWRGPARAWGLSMLSLGVALRALPSMVGRPNAWRSMWTGRRDWIDGYPAVTTTVNSGNGAGPPPVGERAGIR
jgi:GT2 family glycosyltransferase